MGGMDHRLSGFHIFRGVFHRNKSRIVNGNYPVAEKQCVETEESDFSNVKFVSQRHSVFSRTARDRSAASSIFHSDPGTDVPVASGSVAADVSAPSGVGVSTAWATGNSVGVGDGSTYLCSRGHGVATVAGESPHPMTSAAAAAIRKTPNRRLMRSFPVARTPGIRFSDN